MPHAAKDNDLFIIIIFVRKSQMRKLGYFGM